MSIDACHATGAAPQIKFVLPNFLTKRGSDVHGRKALECSA